MSGEAEGEWAPGSLPGVGIPVDAAALQAGGTHWLTRAFQASGALEPGNRVTAITAFEPCEGGSTGRKLLLSVAYAEAGPPVDLFVKFSRAPGDPVRDRGRDQMEPEVHLGALSRTPGFPIAVPACLHADYDPASGTGVLITERVAFGAGPIEPQHGKCLDYRVAEPLDHYRALVGAVARLAGAHRGGRLDPVLAARFPFDAEAAAARDPIRYDDRQLGNRIARFAEFAERFPGLFPAHLSASEFVGRLHEEAPRIRAQEAAIKRFLHADPDLIALCHWNANIDNGWFWRGADGALRCGLIDWGRVGQMSVALALWGALSAAEPQMLERDLDDLLAHFAAEYRAAGGPEVQVDRLRRHFLLFAVTMGLAWLIDAPALILRELPDLAPDATRFDAAFEGNETARAQLLMLTNVLTLWERRDIGLLLESIA